VTKAAKLLVLMAAGAAAALVLAWQVFGGRAAEYARRTVEERLERMLHTAVELRHLSLALFPPRVRAEGFALGPGGGALRACTILDAIENVPVAKTRAKPVRTARAQEKTTSNPRGVSSAMKTAIFTIEGMHCDGCAETIKALLGVESGVQVATVLFKGRNARVLYDSATTNENRLIAAIKRGGYKAVRQPA